MLFLAVKKNFPNRGREGNVLFRNHHRVVKLPLRTLPRGVIGNTAGFGPAIQGSSPCGVALKPLERHVSGAFCVLLPLILPLAVKQQNESKSRTNKARLLGLSPLRSSAAMSRSPLENVAVLLRVFLWGIRVPKGAVIWTVRQARKKFGF